MATITLRGTVKKGCGWATRHGNWQRMLVAHKDELPDIEDYVEGTFNIHLTDPPEWRPPDDEQLRLAARKRGHRVGGDKNIPAGGDFLLCGNYVHPRLKVIALNGRAVEGRIYYAGIKPAEWPWGDFRLPQPTPRRRVEVLSKVNLRRLLGLLDEDKKYDVSVTIEIGEVSGKRRQGGTP